METKTIHFSGPSLGMICRTMIFLFIFLIFNTPAHAFSPKVHIHIGLKIIKQLNDDSPACSIKLDDLDDDGVKFQANPEACNAIRKWPGYFLAGTIGPDGFPDIAFGQMIIHPDTLYNYSRTDQNGTTVENSSEKTITNDWLQHLWNMAHNESAGDAREQALAFVMGYLAHAAGDMWGHTFVNQYAGGSWHYDPAGNTNIKRHLTTERIISNHTPDIKSRVNGLGGLKVPIDFLYKALIDDAWAVKHGAGSFIGYFTDLRSYLEHKKPNNDTLPQDWLKYHYIECWIVEINKGLKAWLSTSSKIANDLFVKDDNSNITTYLNDFKSQYLFNMLGGKPIEMISSCEGIPNEVSAVLNPAEVLNKFLDEIKEETVDRIWDPIAEIEADFINFLFIKAFGLSYDEFKDPATYASAILGHEFTNEIDGLMHINSNGYFDDDKFAIVHNTTVLNKLILLDMNNLDKLLFRYNVGSLYLSTVTQNVMLGFLKSLDGNHQWRIHAPSPPITEPNRSFSIKGMLLWVDCLARKNFFSKVFMDWTSKDVSMIYKDSVFCQIISSLPPVSTSFRLLTNNNRCTPSYAEVTLTNHQKLTPSQPYTIYVTVESPKDVANNTKLPLNEYENGTPRTEWCGKTVPPGDIPYSPIIIKPYNISYKNIFFYKVRRGTLQASATLCNDEKVLVQLPNCYNVDAKVRVYILQEVYAAKKPVEENNTKIPPNPSELFFDPVKAYFDDNYVIKCDSCVIPPCNGTMTVTYKQKIPVTIKVPCQTTCYSDTFDADDDTVYNSDPPHPPDYPDGERKKDDNCPLNPNPHQEDCNYDLIGDACQYCISNLYRDWVQGVLPDPRAEKIFHDLIDRGFAGPIIIDPISPCDLPDCMGALAIEGNYFTALSKPIKEFTQKWMQGAIADKVFFRTIKLIFQGLSQQANETEIRVTQATLAASSKKGLFQGNKLACLTLGLPPKVKGNIKIAIPRVMLDAKKGGTNTRYRIFIDGKEVNYTEVNNAEFRTVAVKISKGARNVKIFGNIMGPQ